MKNEFAKSVRLNRFYSVGTKSQDWAKLTQNQLTEIPDRVSKMQCGSAELLEYGTLFSSAIEDVAQSQKEDAGHSTGPYYECMLYKAEAGFAYIQSLYFEKCKSNFRDDLANFNFCDSLSDTTKPLLGCR